MKARGAVDPGQIQAAFRTPQKQNAPYRVWYPFLETLFLAQADGKRRMRLELPNLDALGVQTRWEAGFPLLQRWDFPVDIELAGRLLEVLLDHLPTGNQPLRVAHSALTAALASHPGEHRDIWVSFLHHEMEPWETWIEVGEGGLAPLVFWGRACLRPSLEWTAERLLERFQFPASWQKGYCPICGSLPALLYLHKEGERQAFCSWCGAEWGLARLQCPYCDNREHDTLGYLYPEGELNYRVQYCHRCRMYFKLSDQRELLAPLFLPLEEWTTLHLDFLAQRDGWQQPPSPAPTVYGG